MKITLSPIKAALCLAAGFLAALPGNAALIEHSTAGILQDDHFETDTVGTAPTQWTVSGTPEVQDFGSIGVNANNGTKFVELFGSESGSGEDDLRTSFTTLGSGLLTASFSFYMVSGTGATGFSRFRVKFFESDGVSVAGQVGFASDTETVEGTTLSFNLDAWNEVSITVDLDAGPTTREDAMNITVNGFSDTADLISDNGVAHVEFTSRLSGGSQVFVDAIAIPEPSSLILMFMAGIGLTVIGWRRR